MAHKSKKINTAEQHDISLNQHDALEKEKEKKAHWLQPYQFKKGQSGNPAGRTPGRSLKEYAKDMLAKMTDEERQEFLHGINKETIWKMVEGNPSNETDITSKGDKIVFLPSEVITKLKDGTPPEAEGIH